MSMSGTFAVKKEQTRIVPAAKNCWLSAAALRFYRTGLEADTARIVAEKFTECGNDSKKIYLQTDRVRLGDFCRRFASDKKCSAAEIRPGRPAKKIPRSSETAGRYFQTGKMERLI